MRFVFCFLLTLMALPVLAGPPPTDGLDKREASALLTRLVAANVASSNCPGFAVGNAQWKFITDTADQLANQFRLTVESYDAQYYAPAFAALDQQAGFCTSEGPKVMPLIEEMIAAGGSVDKYKFGG
jgi:hypothetical protein